MKLLTFSLIFFIISGMFVNKDSTGSTKLIIWYTGFLDIVISWLNSYALSIAYLFDKDFIESCDYQQKIKPSQWLKIEHLTSEHSINLFYWSLISSIFTSTFLTIFFYTFIYANSESLFFSSLLAFLASISAVLLASVTLILVDDRALHLCFMIDPTLVKLAHPAISELNCESQAP